MRKITPMILVMLMLVSALSSFDFAELEETEVIEDTGARSGADADLIAITSPKETVCPVGAECRNVLKVGDSTTFETYIKNSGDADITEMSYTVNIWLSDADGNPSIIAKDGTVQTSLGRTTMSCAQVHSVISNRSLRVASSEAVSTLCPSVVHQLHGHLCKVSTSSKS